MAGIIAMSATYPLDMVRGRLTVQEVGQEQYRGIWHAATTIIRREGPTALYKGWVPSVIGVIPYVGLNFAVYESLKAELVALNGYQNEQDLHVLARVRFSFAPALCRAQSKASMLLLDRPLSLSISLSISISLITFLVKHGTASREQKGSEQFEKCGWEKANFSSVFSPGSFTCSQRRHVGSDA